VNTLEIEVRTLRSALEMIAANFDNSLKALALQRNVVATDIGAVMIL